MNKDRLILLGIAVLFVVFMLRRVEKKTVETPFPPPLPTHGQAPQVVPAPNVLPPAQRPLQPAPPTVPPPDDESAALRDLEVTLKRSMTLAETPDLEKARLECQANPRLAAATLGLVVPEQMTFGPQMASGLCAGDLAVCEQAAAVPQAASGCAVEPCFKQSVPLYRTETMEGSKDGCRTWGAWQLFNAKAAEGRASAKDCRPFLAAALGVKLSDDESDTLCGLFAADIAKGGDSMCREVASKAYGGRRASLKDCAPIEDFVKGPDACPKSPAAGKPSCALLAKTRLAVARKDPSVCAGDPLCAAFLSPGKCDAARFEDFRGPGWNRICDAAVAGVTQLWIQSVSAEGSAAIDLMDGYKRRLSDFHTIDKAKTVERIAQATARIRGAQAKMEKLRRQMNEGKMATSNPSNVPQKK